MKTIVKHLSITAILIAAFSVVAMAGDRNSAYLSQLPTTAQKTIKKNFSHIKISKVSGKRAAFSKNYEVTFANGYKLKFDKDGNWTSIDCKRDAVPSHLIPSQISRYMKKNHRGARINKIEKDKNKWEINLSNGLEVTFDKNFAVTKIN